MTQRWSYRVVSVPTKGWNGGKVDAEQLQRDLDRLGAEGWELATSHSLTEGGGGSKNVLLVFKRPG